MRDLTQDPRWCSVDPVSMAIGTVASLVGSAFAGGNDAPPAPTSSPAAPPPQAPPQTKAQAKPTQQQPTFMGGIPTPPPSTGQKTLLGQ